MKCRTLHAGIYMTATYVSCAFLNSVQLWWMDVKNFILQLQKNNKGRRRILVFLISQRSVCSFIFSGFIFVSHFPFCCVFPVMSSSIPWALSSSLMCFTCVELSFLPCGHKMSIPFLLMTSRESLSVCQAHSDWSWLHRWFIWRHKNLAIHSLTHCIPWEVYNTLYCDRDVFPNS